MAHRRTATRVMAIRIRPVVHGWLVWGVLALGAAHAETCADCDSDLVTPTALDALAAAQVAVTLRTVSPDATAACDVDGTRTVTILDALVIAQAAVGVPVGLACPGVWVEPFTEEAVARGIDYTVALAAAFGAGSAFADLDGDGDQDLVLAGSMTAPQGTTNLGIYENDGRGFFIDRRAGSGLDSLPEAQSVTAADHDDDGDLDLHIGSWHLRDVLARNDGGFTFTDVAAAAGVDDDGAAQGCTWGDYDGDGWLDLYVANRCWSNRPEPPYVPNMNPNRLYRNNGDGTFTDQAAALGVDAGVDPTYQATFFDVDGDGDPDLYLSTDKGVVSACGYRNRLYRNDGGTFTDVSAASGADGCIDAMCIAIGDPDRNGFQDIYVTNTPSGHYLYLNQGGGLFTNAAAAYDVISNAVGWGSVFFDHDNDGWQDLYVCQSIGSFPPNRLYRFGPLAPPAVEVSAALDVADGDASFNCVTGDIDGDGDLDLVVSDSGARVKLYVNHEGSRRSWLTLRMVGEGHNRFAVGATARVTAGGATMLREVIVGSSFKSSHQLALSFGLDTATTADMIEARWPGGATRTLVGYPARRTWTIYPPSRLGDADGDGTCDLDDFLAFADAIGGAVVPGAEMFDFDGNYWLNAGDIAGFLATYGGTLEDCNGNMQADLEDILLGWSLDLDRDGVPDECP